MMDYRIVKSDDVSSTQLIQLTVANFLMHNLINCVNFFGLIKVYLLATINIISISFIFQVCIIS